MLKIDTRDLKRLGRDLHTFAHKAAPYACRDALNQQAFTGRKLWKAKMEREFVLRNKWTAGSIRVEKAKGLNVHAMQSVLGSVSSYLDEAESGQTKHGRGKHGVALPTSASAGQSEGSQPRLKPVRRPYTLKAIQLTDRSSHPKKSIRRLITIRRARKAGLKFAFLETPKSAGIYRIMGGKRRPKIRMLWNISRGTVVSPPHPTLGPTADLVRRKSERFYRLAILKQLRFHRVFGY